ncbi:hypothetical protein ACTQ1D_01870 [Parafannyhessea umbonata]|uniref:hypothetical protein n=1 Tax=Parafannyhessea umbonata TaxID=604330 RepID=UPI003F94C031
MISDEIRSFVKRSYADEHMDPKELLALADRADRETVELPKSTDGKPIYVGETVYALDDPSLEYEVSDINYGINGVAVGMYAAGIQTYRKPSCVSHTRPDSLERIADELEEWSESNRGNGSGEVFYRAGDLADRIRKLVKREGEHGAD